ncbi:hypothetical protein Tco_0462164 [Tanacetum coccineum]
MLRRLRDQGLLQQINIDFVLSKIDPKEDPERLKRSGKAKEEKKRSSREVMLIKTIEQRTKFLHDTMLPKEDFLLNKDLKLSEINLLQEISLESLMTLFEVCWGKVSILFYEKVIKEMNEQATNASKKRVKKDDSVKGEIKAEKIVKLWRQNLLLLGCTRQDLFSFIWIGDEAYTLIHTIDIELILWGDLKIMTESSTEENDQGDFWNNQQDWGLIGSVEEEVNAATTIELAIPEQTATGKGISNPLMAGSLPKTTKPT